jgi:hypothetical protein
MSLAHVALVLASLDDAITTSAFAVSRPEIRDAIDRTLEGIVTSRRRPLPT